MTGIDKIANLDNLVEIYKTGASLKELRRHTNLSVPLIRAALKHHGIPIRPRTWRGMRLENEDAMVARYKAGETAQRLAREWGVSRATIQRCLSDHGVPPRTQTEVSFLRYSGSTKESRKQITAAANEAARGRRVPHESICRSATGRQINGVGKSRHEDAMVSLLAQVGITVSRQLSVDVYNLDIAIESPLIAVEVNGGGWHSYGAHRRTHFRRSKYLINQGWAMIFVWVDTRRHRLGIKAANYVRAVMESIRSNPASAGKYFMVFGNGEPVPATSRYLNTPAIIESICGGSQDAWEGD